MYLSSIHIRTARNLLNIGVREIGLLIHASRTTVSKLENNIINISDMKLGSRRNTILLEFFKKNGITFPNVYEINFHSNKFFYSNKSILAWYQIKGARIILHKKQEELALECQIGIGLLRLLENEKSTNNTAINKLKTTFEEQGIIFPNKESIYFKKKVVDIQKQK